VWFILTVSLTGCERTLHMFYCTAYDTVYLWANVYCWLFLKTNWIFVNIISSIVIYCLHCMSSTLLSKWAHHQNSVLIIKAFSKCKWIKIRIKGLFKYVLLTELYILYSFVTWTIFFQCIDEFWQLILWFSFHSVNILMICILCTDDGRYVSK
jgi:hypothetical protein